MIPVLVKSVWLRNICFSKLATTLFKFIDRFPTHCIEILKQNTKYTLKKTYSKQKREKRLHLCLKKMLLMANYIV